MYCGSIFSRSKDMKALHLSENLPRLMNDEGKFVLLQGNMQSSARNAHLLFRARHRICLAALVLLTTICAVKAVVQRRDLD